MPSRSFWSRSAGFVSRPARHLRERRCAQDQLHHQGRVQLIAAGCPKLLTHASFSAPVVIWPEQQRQVNSGSYPVVAPNGDTYVAWERNIDNVRR